MSNDFARQVFEQIASLEDGQPYIKLNEYSIFLQCPEWIWVAPDESGLRALADEYIPRDVGVYPANGQTGPGLFVTTGNARQDSQVIAAMYRHKTRWHGYMPRVLATPAHWRELRGYLRHIPDHLVTTFTFPAEAFYRFWPISAAEFMSAFGPQWLRRHCTDAHGRIMPELAYRLTVETARGGYANRQRQALNRARLLGDWLRSHHSDVLPALIGIVPEGQAYYLGKQRITFTAPRIMERLRRYRYRTGYSFPAGRNVKEFIRYLEDLGALHYVTSGSFVLAHTWSVGLVYLKNQLLAEKMHEAAKNG